MSRTHLSLALAAALLVSTPAASPAGSLSDYADDLKDWVESGLDRLRDAADRIARKRVVALERVERLIGREHDDLLRELRTARRVTDVLERAYRTADTEAIRVEQLLGGLLDELDDEVDATEADARRGALALEELLPGVSRRAGKLLAIGSDLTARADEAVDPRKRARLLDRAARRIDRARRAVRESGGVVGPYVCHESETGTAAGLVNVGPSSLGDAFAATHVHGLLAITSRGFVSTLRIEATAPDGRVVRMALPSLTFDGVGDYAVGPAVSSARAEVQVGPNLYVGTGGTLSVDAFDLEAKSLSGRFSIEVAGPSGPETLDGHFTICDILRID